MSGGRIAVGEPQRSLASETVSGARWSALARAGQQGISLASTAMLARLLGPDEYGLMGLAMVLVGFLLVFRDLGTAAAVIQRKELSQDLLSGLFWLNAGFGATIGVLCAAVSPLAAAFNREPTLKSLIAVLALSFPLSGIGVVHGALLNRDLVFRKIAVIEISCAAAGAAVSVMLAFSGAGVWSLALANLARTGLESALFWRVCSWRPSWPPRLDGVRSVFSFTSHLSAFHVLNYLGRSADSILIGRILGKGALAYYQWAYTLMLYPLQHVSGAVGKVLFPVFSQMQDDDERFRSAYLRTCIAIAAITFPMMLGMTAVAGPLIQVFLGSKWLPAVPLLTILAPVGLGQSIGATVGHIYMAKGRTDWMFRWGLFSSLLVVGSFIAGLPWGVKGVAVSYAIASYALAYPSFAIPFRLIGLRVGSFAAALCPVLAYSLVTFLAALTVRLLMERSGAPAAVVLAASVAAGAAVHAGLLLYFRPPFLRDLARVFGGWLPQRFPA